VRRSEWHEGRRAWRNLASLLRDDEEAPDGEAALVVLGDVGLLRQLLEAAEAAGVSAARASGRSWSEIAAALGVSRQAVWERWHALDTAPPATTAAIRSRATDTSQEERTMPTIDEVWGRIEAHAGDVFHQKRGASFTYAIASGCVRPDRTNRLLPRSDFTTALELVPSPTTVPFQRLQGPSYVWAILHDPRIRRDDW
jgi:hypothetical protein